MLQKDRTVRRLEDGGSTPRFAARHHFVEVVQHVGHTHGSRELADPLPNGNDFTRSPSAASSDAGRRSTIQYLPEKGPPITN
jgi:hypothetical protein